VEISLDCIIVYASKNMQWTHSCSNSREFHQWK